MSHSKHHSSHRSPADILMYGHPGAHRAAGGSMPSNEPHYAMAKGGGRPRSYMRDGRHCHAEGDTVGEMGVNPVNGYKYPGNPENKRKGGRACHAEGDSVEAVPYKRGGRSYQHRKHREEGGNVYAEGGDIDREHHNFGDVVSKIGSVASNVLPFLSMFLKKGGSAHHKHRRHHAEGDTVYAEGDTVESHRRGGRTHRRHHLEGDEVPLKRAMGGAGKVRKGMMRGDGSLA